MKKSRVILVMIVIALVGAAPFVAQRNEPAGAFGSVYIAGSAQRPVHEAITRTLSCPAVDAVVNCFEPLSIDILAGRQGTWGGVGTPDDPLDGSPNPAARHCDDVDQPWGYGNRAAAAQEAFDECLEWFQSYMDFAVESAARLIGTDGSIDAAQTRIVNISGSTYNACSFPDPKKGNTSSDSAKCNVLNGLGRALHAAEDLWSHSNWGDLVDPSKDVGIDNPPGLGRTDQPQFLSYPGPRSAAVPAGFVSGCDDSIPLINDCRHVDFASGIVYPRLTHSTLNKDNGNYVDGLTCSGRDPLTSRGKVVVDGVSNFQRAITGACGAARRVWSDFQTALTARFGAAPAATMIRAISTDHPSTTCDLGGEAAGAHKPPVGDLPSARSVTIEIINHTSQALLCGEAILDGGEWASYPPDSIGAGLTARFRTQSNGLATGTEGEARMRFSRLGRDDFIIKWNNPYWGSNDYSCRAPAGYSCERTGGSGNDSTITVTFTGP